MRRIVITAIALAAAACKQDVPPPVYQAVAVEARDIVVSARASGVIEPDTLVEVKSKASGEITEIAVETGQLVPRGTLMVQVDRRQARNTSAQAEANLEVARARLQNAEAQRHRSEELFKSQSITQTEYETAVLDYANAKANVVNAEVAVENASIQLGDTEIRAPMTGTIITKLVERGAVISSPTTAASGGTVLLTMADLGLVRVRTLIDETDIGKIQPGQRATVTVDAYPNQPFDGEVLKVEPQAETQQNVTMFPVLVRINNRNGLLKPGMSAEVEVHIGNRESVLAVPNTALRTDRDVASAAEVLGLAPADVEATLAAAAAGAPNGRASLGGAPADSGAAKPRNTMTTPDGREIPLPEGVTEAQVRAAFAKMRSGEELSAEERAVLQKMRSAMGNRAGGRMRGASSDYQFGGQYIVFTLRDGVPVPVRIRTGLTDLEYSEVTEGLASGDSVLTLPSASLIQSQQEFRQRINNMTGGGGLPGMRSQQSGTQSGTPAGGGGR
jgi:HlyD family secretion protein